VSCATHAIICLDGADHFENVGKQPLQQSGKYRVNENDEKISRIPRAYSVLIESEPGSSLLF
jgi:hypothetical protein